MIVDKILDMEWQNKNGHLDAKDTEILNRRAKLHQFDTEPRVGDYIQMLDRSMRRFTHYHCNGMQTTCNDSLNFSFYLGDGYTSFSGTLDPIIKFRNIKSTQETCMAKFWFFHHDLARAHNGIDGWFKVKIWKEVR